MKSQTKTVSRVAGEPPPVQRDPFGSNLTGGDAIGSGLAGLGDLDGDSVPDIAAGVASLDVIGPQFGGTWIIYLRSDGSVKAAQLITAGAGALSEGFNKDDLFGWLDLAGPGDINGDGTVDLVVPAEGDDDGGPEKGAIYILFHLASLAPGLTIHQPTPNPSDVGSDITIIADIAAASGVVDPEVRFRRGGDPSFFSAPMQLRDDKSYAFSIPAFAVSGRGVEYAVQAKNGQGVASESALHSIPVHVPDGYNVTISGGTDAASYRLFSVPAELDEKNARTALEDDLGPYDVSEWRLYGLEQGPRLVELPEKEVDLEPGRAFWMLARAENTAVNPGAGTSISTEVTYPVRLSGGWNLIGNPYAFEIPMSNVSTTRGQATDLWAYDGSWSVETTAIVPFSGYAVFSDGADTLLIDPDLSPSNVGEGDTQESNPSVLAKQRRGLETLFGSADSQRPESRVRRPASFTAYPNPFQDAVTFEFDLTEETEVTAAVHDVLGRRVTTLLDDAMQRAGRHMIRWNGADGNGARVAAGLYFYRLTAGTVERTGVVVRTR